MMLGMWPALPEFEIENVSRNDEGAYIVEARAGAITADCPVCQRKSTAQHSWYQRKPRDLPSIGEAVQLQLNVRRFFCRNASCKQQVFCERLPQLVQVYARRTNRLAETLTMLAFGLTSQEGTIIVDKMGMTVSRTGLNRAIRQHPTPVVEEPTAIGIDDWAYRKGHHYGTIVCDLETGDAIDLLPDRKAQTVTEWLKEHPSIEIVARDRSREYARGVTDGAPQAVQVADRWHLMNNLVEAVEQAVTHHAAKLQRTDPNANEGQQEPIAQTGQEAQSDENTVADICPDELTPAQVASRAARLERYEQVVSLRQSGLYLGEIITRTGVGRRTIERWLKSDGFPERKQREPNQFQVLDAFFPYLEAAWDAGCTNAAQLYRDIHVQGYAGGYQTVAKYAWQKRRNLPIPFPQERRQRWAQPATASKLYTPKQAAFLFIRRQADLAPHELSDRDKMIQCSPELETTFQLAKEFARMLRERDADALPHWIDATQCSQIDPLQRFANGIAQDKPEVLAALTYHWNSGTCEGNVNRLKMIKRRMYGRANFDLLRQRVLYHLE